MNLRSKAIALLAGSALALSTAAGVTAQTVTAELEPGADNCSASITAGTNLGTYTWDGFTYTGTAGTFTVTATQTQSPLSVECSFNITGEDLVHESEVEEIISAADIALTADSATGFLGDPGLDFTVSTAAGTGTLQDIEVDLSGAFTSQMPGTYSGTVTITTQTAEPE